MLVASLTPWGSMERNLVTYDLKVFDKRTLSNVDVHSIIHRSKSPTLSRNVQPCLWVGLAWKS